MISESGNGGMTHGKVLVAHPRYVDSFEVCDIVASKHDNEAAPVNSIGMGVND